MKLKINKNKEFSVKPGFVKTRLHFIHIIYHVNLYFLVVYNTHCCILRALMKLFCLTFVLGIINLNCLVLRGGVHTGGEITAWQG